MGNLWIPWLADAARLTGYPVVECPDWRSHGHGGLRALNTVTGHHTANPQRGDYPSLNIVRNGRGDLAGPLSQYGLGRSGTIYVIAAGQCWQAGASRWAGFTDLNDEGIGIEAESAGTRDDWTPEQRDCYPRLIAAILHYMRRGEDRFGFHKEVCVPRGRKIDAAYWDGDTTRKRIKWLLGDPLKRIPRFAAPPKEEDIVATLDDLRNVLHAEVPEIVRKTVFDTPLKRGGGGQSGNATLGALGSWTDSAWTADRKRDDELSAKVDKLQSAVDALVARLGKS